MDDHVLRFRKEPTAEDPIRYGPLLRQILDALVDGCQQATRLRIEGRSTANGTPPGWLESAAAFHVDHLRAGELVLHGSPLGNAVPARMWPPSTLAAGAYEPQRSSLDLLEDSLEQAISGNLDSDRYDRNLLETFESFGRLFEHGIEAIELINGRTVRLDSRGLSTIHERRAQMREDSEVSVSGTLRAIWYDDRFFALGLDNGTLVRGIVAPAILRSTNLGLRVGQRVNVRGVARFQPSGAMFRIDADRLGPAGTAAKPVDVKVKIHRLVEEGRVREARQLVKEEEDAGRGVAIEAWAKVLALPKVEMRPAGKGEDMSLNHAWLTKHQAEHVGAWVALHDGELVDSDRSFLALQKRLRANQQGHVFLTKCGGAGDTKSGT